MDRLSSEQTLAHAGEHPGDSLICVHVFRGERPLLHVYREPDGFWTFTCGRDDHVVKEDVLPVCHRCALAGKGVAGDLAALRPGFQANRAGAAHCWRITPLD